MDPKKFLENDEGVNCCDISIIRLEDITIYPPTEFEMEVWKEHFQNQEFDGLLDMVREKKAKLKERFSGVTWKREVPQEVFSIGKALEAEKPSVKKQIGRRNKKKSQRDILKATENKLTS